MKFANIGCAGAVVACLAVSLAVGPAAASSGPVTVAGVAADACAGQPKKKIVKKYYRGPTMVPLRCGTKTWGYKHLVDRGRWSASFSKKIDSTIWSGSIAVNEPGEVTYVKKQPACPPRITFKVVTNPGKYGRDPRINPQGVISAYKPSGLAAAC